MIIMCIQIVLHAAVSFRAAGKAVYIAVSQFDAIKRQAIPSYKSICRWLQKIGLYKLRCPKEQADDWAVIVDNSVQVGTQKCMVILGVRLSKFNNKALTLEDMDVLSIELHETTNAEIVCAELEKAQQRVGKVVQVCADDGPDIRGGIELFCSKHGAIRIFDAIHKIGVFLKACLGTNIQWQSFTQAAAEAKKKMQQTPGAHLAPPNQRAKSRFLNIDILVRWAIDIMEALNTKEHPDKDLLEQYCGWVRQYSELITQVKQFDLISRTVRDYIREKGVSSTTGQQIEKTLEEVLTHEEFNMEACQYAGMLIDFFSKQSEAILPGQTFIGSSEIIESLFGKLKSLEQDQSKGGFTSLILGVAACVGKLDIDLVKNALTQIKTVDVNSWAKEHIGETILSKRRKALGSWRKITQVVQKPTGNSLCKAAGF